MSVFSNATRETARDCTRWDTDSIGLVKGKHWSQLVDYGSIKRFALLEKHILKQE